MSSTRHQKPGSDPADAPERYLSHPSITGINVGIRYIGAAAPVRTLKQTRASVWLFNYARLSQATADSVADLLKMTQREIRDCLGCPTVERPLLERFGDGVAQLRADFESRLPALSENSVTKVVRRGVREGAAGRVFSLIIGSYRIGKTAPFRDEFFRNYMDRSVFVDVPSGGDMRSFTSALAASLGIATNSAKKNEVIAEQIIAALSTGIVELVKFDEGQYLWPRDPKKFPEKINFIRHCWDKADFHRAGRVAIDGKGGLGFATCATPQFSDDLNAALAGPLAAGQFEGRLRRNFCPDTLTAAEIEGIARINAPEFNADSIRKLVAVTLASPGLLGFLTNVIGKTRFLAEEDGAPISPALVKLAAQEMLRGTEIERLAKEAAGKELAAAA